MSDTFTSRPFGCPKRIPPVIMHAENVETVGGDIGAQRAELFQPRVQLRGTQVAEQFEVFTQQRAALWLLCWRQVFT
ncbi:hypothetical protein N5929_22430 [Enterobacter hormaechei]|nr:hypothetical protein [Enterobacter hormaechei]WIF24790.1 hypothetical protein N5929_22430 [Enterobacter hormaechei]